MIFLSIACPRECSANSGSGYCLTALDNTDIDQRCCRYLSAPGSHCFTNCVGPRFSILASPVFPLCIPKSMSIVCIECGRKGLSQGLGLHVGAYTGY